MRVDFEQNDSVRLWKFERITLHASRYIYWIKLIAKKPHILHWEINQYKNQIMLGL